MTVDELVQLPGVGRKTANVITSVIDSQPNMAVDTHVFRVSARLGLTNRAKTPLSAEKQLTTFYSPIIGAQSTSLAYSSRTLCVYGTQPKM
jgi:endonuclease III